MREQTEKRFARLMGRLLREQKKRILKVADSPFVELGEAFWNKELEHFQRELTPFLVRVFTEGGESVFEDTLSTRKQDPQSELLATVIERAIEFAKSYSFELITQINGTTRRLVEKAVVEFVSTPGFTVRDFIDLTKDVFGAKRASTIAVTETTRAYAQAGQVVANEIRGAGIELTDVWNTNNDALTCPICGPRHRQPRGNGWNNLPPAHPECRCWITHEIVNKAKTE
jgi:hypothetical protein